MKSWQKEALKLGLPILLDWIKSLFGNKEKKKLRQYRKIATQALKDNDIKKYLEYQNLINLMEE